MHSREQNCSARSEAVEMSLVALLILEIVLGILGNAIALWTFYFQVKIWKPYTVYLFNLVVADILLMVCLPFRIDFFLRQKRWVFGDVFCRIMLFSLVLSRACSIAFLTAVTAERYFRVIQPHSRVNQISVRTAKAISRFIWLLVMAFSVQILTTSQMRESTIMCRSFHLWRDYSFRAVWHDAMFFAEFIIPFGFILFATTAIVKKLRERNMEKELKVQRAVHLLAVVLVVFVICFMPSILARASVLILQRSAGCMGFSLAVNSFDVTICLTYLNSAMDPIVYCFSSPTFRHSYKRALNSLRRKEPVTFDISKDADT